MIASGRNKQRGKQIQIEDRLEAEPNGQRPVPAAGGLASHARALR